MNRKAIDSLKTAYDSMLDKYGDSLVAVLLFGSQNYFDLSYLNDDESDFEFKAIVIPSMHDMVLGKTEKGKKHTFDFGEVTVYTLKDYVVSGLIKQNINFVETLFTDYKLVNPRFAGVWGALENKREEIARMDESRAAQAMFGMIKQCQKRYYNRAQERDCAQMRKMASNVHRLSDMMVKYAFDRDKETSYEFSLKMSPRVAEEVYTLKRGKHHPMGRFDVLPAFDPDDWIWIQELMEANATVAQEYLNLARAGELFAPRNLKLEQWLLDFVVEVYEMFWLIEGVDE